MAARLIACARACIVIHLVCLLNPAGSTCATVTVDWGKVLVLTSVPKSITMTNESLVPANYRTLLRKSDSPFMLSQTAGTLAPGECAELEVLCRLDDTVKSTNELILQMENAPEQVVALTAMGSGATITASRDLKAIEFGENFSSRVVREEFVLENLGRKAQQLTWLNSSMVVTKEREGDEKVPLVCGHTNRTDP